MRAALVALAAVIACSSSSSKHAPDAAPDATVPGPCGLPFQPYTPTGCVDGGLAAIGFGSGTWQVTGTEHIYDSGPKAFAIDVSVGSDHCGSILGNAPPRIPMPARWYIDDSVAMAVDANDPQNQQFWRLCADGSGVGSAYGETRFRDLESGLSEIATWFDGTFSR